jgi:hypothetical protein
MGGVEILGFDKDLLSNPEIRCGLTSSISQALILILRIRHLILKELMELIKVNCGPRRMIGLILGEWKCSGDITY